MQMNLQARTIRKTSMQENSEFSGNLIGSGVAFGHSLPNNPELSLESDMMKEISS